MAETELLEQTTPAPTKEPEVAHYARAEDITRASVTGEPIQALCGALRKNVNEEGIRVTLIEPGAVDTPMQRKSVADKARRVRAMEMIEPDDIAECIRFALSQPKRVDIVSMQVRPLKQLI